MYNTYMKIYQYIEREDVKSSILIITSHFEWGTVPHGLKILFN